MVKNPPANAGDAEDTHLIFPGEGNGNPLKILFFFFCLCQKIYLLLIVSEVKMSVFMIEERLQKPGRLYVYKKMSYFTCNQKHYSSKRGTFSLFVFLHDHHNKLK